MFYYPLPWDAFKDAVHVDSLSEAFYQAKYVAPVDSSTYPLASNWSAFKTLNTSALGYY